MDYPNKSGNDNLFFASIRKDIKVILLDKYHPYVLLFDADVIKLNNGYEVRYRDFDSVKQEVFFTTEEEAKLYASMLKTSCCLIDEEYYGERITDNHVFWCSLWTKSN